MRKLLLLCALLVSCSTLRAQDVSTRYQGLAITSRGLPAANQNVAVCTQPANTSTTPCSPLATLGTSTSTSSGGTNPIPVCTSPGVPTSGCMDSNGNFFFYAPSGKYTVQIYGPQIGTPFVIPDQNMACAPSANCNFSSINNIRYATSFAGADIFAQANTAIAAGCANGKVIIPPGIYNGITTTLVINSSGDNCTVEADGTTLNYTGTGTAIQILHATKSKLIGDAFLIGPGTGTATVGIQLGATLGPAQQTIQNYIAHWRISGFGKAFVGEGTAAFGGTYYNTIEDVAAWRNGALGNGQGFFLQPTNPNWFNNNTFLSDSCQWATTDCWVLNGANDNTIVGGDSENNTGCGVRIGETQQTNDNTFVGLHQEANTTADWCSTNPVNINGTQVIGGVAGSATACTGVNGCRPFWFAGIYNTFTPNRFPGVIAPAGGTRFQFNINSSAQAAAVQYQIFNGESPGSTFTSIFGVNRTGANNGSIDIGPPEYPLRIQSMPLANGAVFTVTGTGACSTSDSKVGGAWSGTLRCTGATAASTLVITPGSGVSAPNGIRCSGDDLTTTANRLSESANTTTTCTISGTVNQNDFITFSMNGF